MPQPLAARVRAQALAAVAEADCVVCVLDGAAGLAPADRDTIRLLSRARQARVLRRQQDRYGRARAERGGVLRRAARIVSSPSRPPTTGACARSSTPWWRGSPARPAASDEPAGTRLALLGRPNVGKSSLLNRLLGTEHALVAPEAGTTRDAIDTPVRIDGRPYVLIDTAGIRRRGRGNDALERHGAVRALGVIERSDLVLFVLDATDGMTDQDARLVGRAWDAGRGLIVLANKWDLTSGPQRDVRTFRRALQASRPGFAGAPASCACRHGRGRGSRGSSESWRDVERGYRATMPTPALNRALRAAVDAHAPPSPEGRPVRLLYATQTASAPPEVTVFASAPERVPEAYTRYLRTRFGEAFGLVGVPLRVRLRPRREADRPHDASR